MNLIEIKETNQQKTNVSVNNLSRDLQQAVKIINAEYQKMDAEDRIFLTRAISKAIENLSNKGGSYVGN
jgi:plasmid stability protein